MASAVENLGLRGGDNTIPAYYATAVPMKLIVERRA